MKKVVLLLTLLTVSGLALAAPSWIHNNSEVTGFRVLDDQIVVYFTGGAGPCGGNGEYPFRIKASLLSSSETFAAMQSAVLFAYASNKKISVYGETCETITQVRVHDSTTTKFGSF